MKKLLIVLIIVIIGISAFLFIRNQKTPKITLSHHPITFLSPWGTETDFALARALQKEKRLAAEKPLPTATKAPLLGCFIALFDGQACPLSFFAAPRRMGKRKSTKAPAKKKGKKLSTQFNCPYCNHEKSVDVKIVVKDQTATLKCSRSETEIVPMDQVYIASVRFRNHR